MSKLFYLAIILASSFLVHALSIEHSVRRDHAMIAMKRRSAPSPDTSSVAGKRCKVRSNSTSTSTSTTPTVTHASATPSASPKSPSPSPSPAPASTSSSGNKKVGIAWSSGDDPALKDWAIGQASVVYTWSAYLPSNTYGLEGIPMLWGPSKLAEFQKLVVKGYAKTAMGFNEPDIASQSNMDPTYAAQFWKDNMNPLKSQGYTLVSPATVTGTAWMESWSKACNGGCQFDIVAMHWYGTQFSDLKTALEAMHTAFNKPIWLTEFACQSFSGNVPQCNSGQVWSLMQQIKDYAANTSWLEKIFWFGAMHDMTNVNVLDQLMATDGSPNALGQLFLS